jgi:PAS domain-containing protein
MGRWRSAERFEYELAGTPCERVMVSRLCHYLSAVARQFPRAPLPEAMGMDCYLGTPLLGRGGMPLGVLAVMHDRPLRDPEHARALVQFSSVRAAAELESLRMVDELRISELRYHALFEAANDAIFVARRVRVAQCNSKALELFRCTEKELVGKTVAELSPPLQPDGCRSLHKPAP